MIFAAIIGIANYAIYMATIDYMITAYGPYSASATGGNGWSRDFLAGVLTLPATPFYTNIGGKHHLQHASTILFCISFVLVIAVYVIYWKGPLLRKRSPFAQELKRAAQDSDGRRPSFPPGSGYMSESRRQSIALRTASRVGSMSGIGGLPGVSVEQQKRAKERLARLAENAERERDALKAEL